MSDASVAALIVLAAIVAGILFQFVTSRIFDSNDQISDPGVFPYPHATISRQMVPHISALDLAGATITIWGYDAFYLHDNSKSPRLVRALTAWLEAGASIDYVFCRNGVRIPDCLATIHSKYPEQLSIWMVDHLNLDKHGLDVLSRLETLHPTLISLSDAGEFAMWVEYDHPPRSTEAFDAYFYSPDAMRRKDLRTEYQAYRKQIDSLPKIRFAGTDSKVAA